MANWFEIPVVDFDRARDFYKHVMNFPRMDVDEGDGFKIGFFMIYKNKVSGAIVQAKGYEPSAKGPLIYLNAEPSMDRALERVIEAGGTIKVPKTKVSEKMGFIARFLDTEGNLLALHSKS